MPELKYLTAKIIRFRDERDRGHFYAIRYMNKQNQTIQNAGVVI